MRVWRTKQIKFERGNINAKSKPNKLANNNCLVYRLRLYFDTTSRINLRLIVLTGLVLTVIVLAKYSDQIGIIKLLGIYAQGAVSDINPEPKESQVLNQKFVNCNLH